MKQKPVGRIMRAVLDLLDDGQPVTYRAVPERAYGIKVRYSNAECNGAKNAVRKIKERFPEFFTEL